MSQPHNFSPDEQDPLAVAIKNREQLIAVFEAGARPRGQALMGIEYEMFAHDRVQNKPLSYKGPVSITTLFNHIAKNGNPQDPWEPVMEGDNIVALNSKRCTIALEPGGQVELAMTAVRDLAKVNQEFISVLAELQRGALDLSIDLFAIGVHPVAERKDMAQVLKKRYKIMRDYMTHRQALGLDMMTRTCSIQLNVDYCDERDLVEKIRLGAALMPVLALLCSSSAFLEGKPTTHALERAHVWQNTDADRTGFPSIIFDDDFGYESWVELALDVPMYFIRRGTSYIGVPGASFRDFIAHGLKGEQALVRDFVDHLTTIFSEVRLKPFLELRSCDSLPGVYVTALSSLTWALLYDDQANSKASAVFQGMSHQELLDFYKDVTTEGRAASFRGEPIFKLAGRLLGFATESLKPSGLQHYLDPFNYLIERNTTCAEFLRHKFSIVDDDNFGEIIKVLSPLAPPLVVSDR